MNSLGFLENLKAVPTSTLIYNDWAIPARPASKPLSSFAGSAAPRYVALCPRLSLIALFELDAITLGVCQIN